jgi:tetratricopeptide (TPR) repeat protein
MARRKSKPKKIDHSQRMNRLKAKALTKVAGQAWGYDQRHRSIVLLTEALRRDPNNPEIILNLAAACGRQRNYEKAEALLARLLELAPRKASIHRRVAQAYAVIDRPERAVECYRRSLELNSDTSMTVPTLLDLANLYERRHQLADAQAVVEEALAREPANEEALLQRAVLDRRLGEAARAETGLRGLVADKSHTWQTRAQAWYELAQMLDDNEHYDDAFEALIAAKRLITPHAAGALQQNQETLLRNQQLMQALDKSHFDGWRELAEKDSAYRLAILTSHPRSGTTLVEQLLDSHDQMISADEFDVFTQWVYLPIVRRFPHSTHILSVFEKVPAVVRQKARARYWQQTEAIFDEPIGERMLLDKNPGMMILLPVILWAFPEMKMLVALRDPRDVVLSCFMQKVPLTPISSNWLTLAGAADYYARTMNTWLLTRSLLSSSPPGGGATEAAWLEFRYEDVVSDLEREARRILEFLGLAWDEKVLKFYEHAREKIVRSPTYKDVTQPVYHKSVGRWKHYARHFEPVLETLEPFIKEFGYSSV